MASSLKSSAKERTKATPSSGPATTYRYDQPGHLTALERAAEGKVTAIAEWFTYDGLGLLATRTVSGTAHRLVWDPTESPEALLSDGEYSYVYGPGGLPIEQISSGESPTYLHHDQLGSTRLITSASGETTGTFTYGPYGASTGSTGYQQDGARLRRAVHARAERPSISAGEVLRPDDGSVPDAGSGGSDHLGALCLRRGRPDGHSRP